MGDLKQVVLIINQQTISLNQHLAAVAEIRDKALEAFPVIEDNIHKLTTGFSIKIAEQLTVIQRVMNEQKEIIKDVVDENKQTMGDATKSFKKESKNLADSLPIALEKTNQIIENSFTKFDKQMQDEIERCIRTMGSHLASLSEKFVKDYKPLTTNLQELLASLPQSDKGR